MDRWHFGYQIILDTHLILDATPSFLPFRDKNLGLRRIYITLSSVNTTKKEPRYHLQGRVGGSRTHTEFFGCTAFRQEN